MGEPLPTLAAELSPGARVRPMGDNDHFFGRRLWSAIQAGREAGQHGLQSASIEDLLPAHALAERLMATRLAPLWALASAHAHTQSTAWIYREAVGITGTWLCLPLTWDGEASLRSGRFSFAVPRLDELCRPGDEVSGVYMWFAGGATANARRAIMRASAAWFAGVLSGLRVYGRAASDDGARAMATFSFRRLAPERPELFIRDPGRQVDA